MVGITKTTALKAIFAIQELELIDFSDISSNKQEKIYEIISNLSDLKYELNENNSEFLCDSDCDD